MALEVSVQLCYQLHAKQQSLGAAPLHAAESATCVQVRNGQQIVSDRLYAETKEQLAGYFLIDVKDREAAIAIAAQFPGTRRGTTEIRPVIRILLRKSAFTPQFEATGSPQVTKVINVMKLEFISRIKFKGNSKLS